MIIVNQKLWRGGRPTDMAALKKCSIKSILSLQDGWFEFFTNKRYEEDEQAREAGIELFHLRLSDFRAPTKFQLEQCLAVLTRESNQPVYIHCKHGVDRTGFVVAAYRVVIEGWDIEKAIDEWKYLGFHRFWYWWWPGVLRKHLSDWKAA